MNTISPYVMPGIKHMEAESPDVVILKIQSAISVFTKIPWVGIVSKNRSRHLVIARCVFCHFAKLLTPYSLKAIGEFLGNRDHTTIIWCLQNAKNMISVDDPNFMSWYNPVREYLSGTMHIPGEFTAKVKRGISIPLTGHRPKIAYKGFDKVKAQYSNKSFQDA